MVGRRHGKGSQAPGGTSHGYKMGNRLVCGFKVARRKKTGCSTARCCVCRQRNDSTSTVTAACFGCQAGEGDANSDAQRLKQADGCEHVALAVGAARHSF